MFNAKLPPIPAATQNPLTQLLTAIGQFPQQQDEAKARKADAKEREVVLQQQQAQMETETRKTAMAKLGTYYRMLQSDPTHTRARDANFIRAVNDAAKEAGLPNLTIEANGQQAVDLQALNHVVNGKLLSELDPSDRQRILASQPGQQREAAEIASGLDPSAQDQTLQQAPGEMGTTEKVALIKDFTQQLAAVSTGNGTSQSAEAFLQFAGGKLAAAGYGVADVTAILNSPDYKENVLGPMARARMAELDALGISKEAQAAYYKQKTVDEPLALQHKIENDNTLTGLRAESIRNTADYRAGLLRQGDARIAQAQQRLQNDTQKLAIEAQRVDAYTQNINSQVDARHTAVARAYAGAMKPRVDALRAQYGDLTRLASSYIANSADHTLPPDLQKQMTQVQNSLQQAEAAMSMATSAAVAGDNATASRLVGAPTTLHREQQPGTRIDVNNLPPGTVSRYSGTKTQYRTPDGTIYDYKGARVR